MSAFLAVTYSDRVELLTDAVALDRKGRVAAIKEKVWASSAAPLAITGRGNTRILAMLAWSVLLMARCGTFDGTIERLARVLERLRGRAIRRLGVELLIVGISEASGPAGRFLSLMSGDGRDLDLRDIDAFAFAGPAIDLAALPYLGDGLRHAGGHVMDVARRTADADASGRIAGPVHGVGGFVLHTVVDAAGVRSTRIKTWPADEVGKRIQPVSP